MVKGTGRVVGWALGFALILPGMDAEAGNLDSVRAQAEASLLIQGEIEIERDGHVSKVSVDREERLTPTLVDFVRDQALHWKFAPIMVDGEVVRARSPMSIRLVAKPAQDGNFQLRLASADFSGRAGSGHGDVRWGLKRSPAYPTELAVRAVTATVYLVLKIGRDGNVADSVVEQVNLRAVGREEQMAEFRRLFANSSIAAAKRWRFLVPTEGPDKDETYWSVRVPVNYQLEGEPDESQSSSYGRWFSYIPGPRVRAPWMQAAEPAGFSPDALPAGGLFIAGDRGPKLLTPLQGG